MGRVTLPLAQVGFALLSAAVLIGAGLAALRASRRVWRGWWPGWLTAAVHGTLGAAGLAALAAAIATGSLHGPFAWDAAILIAAALLSGLAMAYRVLRTHSGPGAVLLLHISLAVIGYLLVIGLALG
jgi:hypothetical protein